VPAAFKRCCRNGFQKSRLIMLSLVTIGHARADALTEDMTKLNADATRSPKEEIGFGCQAREFRFIQIRRATIGLRGYCFFIEG
jgi:hypothetical protein